MMGWTVLSEHRDDTRSDRRKRTNQFPLCQNAMRRVEAR